MEKFISSYTTANIVMAIYLQTQNPSKDVATIFCTDRIHFDGMKILIWNFSKEEL